MAISQKSADFLIRERLADAARGSVDALYELGVTYSTGRGGIAVDLIEPFGFVWDDRRLRRAGMDYLDAVDLTRHSSWNAYSVWRAGSDRAGRLVLRRRRGRRRPDPRPRPVGLDRGRAILRCIRVL